MKHICMDCDKNAAYIRHTQFAGSHPYCVEHARKEKDFNDEDWETLIDEVRDQTIDEITDASSSKK